MRRAVAGAVLLAGLVFGCGDDEPEPPDEATLVACETELRTLNTAAELYDLAEGRSPETVEDLEGAEMLTPDEDRLYDLADGEPQLTDEGEDMGCPEP